MARRHYRPIVVVPHPAPAARPTAFRVVVPRLVDGVPVPAAAPTPTITVALRDIDMVCWVCGVVDEVVRERRYFFMPLYATVYQLFVGRACNKCVDARKVPLQ